MKVMHKQAVCSDNRIGVPLRATSLGTNYKCIPSYSDEIHSAPAMQARCNTADMQLHLEPLENYAH